MGGTFHSAVRDTTLQLFLHLCQHYFFLLQWSAIDRVTAKGHIVSSPGLSSEQLRRNLKIQSESRRQNLEATGFGQGWLKTLWLWFRIGSKNRISFQQIYSTFLSGSVPPLQKPPCRVLTSLFFRVPYSRTKLWLLSQDQLHHCFFAFPSMLPWLWFSYLST